MSLAGICRIIPDIHKCKNDNVFSDQVFVLLMFSNEGESEVKSVQSALSDLLTTFATHGTFSRQSTKRGLILIGLELNTNARESFEHC